MENGSAELKKMDLGGMASWARAWVEELRHLGVSPAEIRDIEELLKQERTGEAYVKAGALKTIVEEMREDALSRKLLEISRRGERCVFDILEISRNLADMEIWKQYVTTGHTDFDRFCEVYLKVRSARARAIVDLSSSFSFRPGELAPGGILNALVNVAEILSSRKEK